MAIPPRVSDEARKVPARRERTYPFLVAPRSEEASRFLQRRLPRRRVDGTTFRLPEVRDQGVNLAECPSRPADFTVQSCYAKNHQTKTLPMTNEVYEMLKRRRADRDKTPGDLRLRETV